MFKFLSAFFLHPQSIVVGSGFASLSLLMSTWTARLPELKASLQLHDGQLGNALLALSLGSLAMSPVSSYIMDRYPTGKTTFASVLIMAMLYFFPFVVDNYPLFLISMFILGLSIGFLTITANASATIVEKKYQLSIMSSCHGMFSIGAILGGSSAWFIVKLGISPMAHMGGLIAFIILVNLLIHKVWFSIPDSDLKAPLFAIPTLPVLGYTTITFCIVLAELTILDWSGVYLSDSLHSGAALAGMGIVGFSVTMAIGRLGGDAIVPVVGKRNIIVFGCLIAGLGLALAAFTQTPFIAILGFSICGVGMAVTVPLLYSLSANMDKVSPAVGIASIATACVFAGLVGRPLVGMVSEYAGGMSVSMWIAAGFAVVAAVIGTGVRSER